jgi:FAD synthase
MQEMWTKKIHVKSSLSQKEGQYSLFIGRWQPLHDGHKSLFNRVLLEGGNVCIAIRDVKPDEKNPYTASEVMHNISIHYASEIAKNRVRVIVIPDICSVEFGRGVGYDIVEHVPPTEISEISATKVREQLRKEGKL